MPLVDVRAVHKHYGNNHVLKGVDLSVDSGQVVAIIGRSGSGKSTLLRSINGLEAIQSGQIVVDDAVLKGSEGSAPSPAQLRALRLNVGMVFQQFNLFPHLTAGENVALSPTVVKGVKKPEAAALARQMLAKVGLGDKYDSYPDQLSGGQQQRVAIARALVTSPSLILADEPTGNLDTRTSIEIMALFQELNAQGITIVLVTHEHDIADHARRIVEMRDGRVVRDVPVANRRDATRELAAAGAAA